MGPNRQEQVMAILNAAWLVRHYVRGGRLEIQREQRDQAIRNLGLIVRDAFNTSEEFESLLAAIVDGLRPRNDPPF